ncbi:hypothetical protein, partial [Fischerella muscicola]|uniref:hypothetical protein n=1 Tax=Fischerella muscicola TaxID=92938 RepID=UPI00055136EB
SREKVGKFNAITDFNPTTSLPNPCVIYMSKAIRQKITIDIFLWLLLLDNLEPTPTEKIDLSINGQTK